MYTPVASMPLLVCERCKKTLVGKRKSFGAPHTVSPCSCAAQPQHMMVWLCDCGFMYMEPLSNEGVLEIRIPD